MKKIIQIRGITLVELMIAMAVSAILLLGVGIIYGNAKHTYTVDEEFARLQENARFAMNFLIDDIRAAGSLGCAKNDGGANIQCLLTTPTSQCKNLVSGIEGYNAGTSSLTTTGSGATLQLADSNTIATNWNVGAGAFYSTGNFPFTAVLGSDIITVRHADSTIIRPAGTITLPAASFNVQDPNSLISTDDILIVSDCSNARIVQATSIDNGGTANETINMAATGGTGTPGNDTGTTVPAYNFQQATSDVSRFLTHTFYIGINGRYEPALFRYNGVTSEELVSGVESMQILYGVETTTTNPDGVANQYVPANSGVVNFASTNQPVVSVRIALLMRSEKNIPNRPVDTQSYTLLDSTITHATGANGSQDQRLRKIFTTTIKIRNK